jgi:nucleoside-diphosphate-sugar epimerase
MKILITGHKGFVGSHYVKYFNEDSRDHEVIGVDIKEGNDCRDYFKSSNVRFDLIIHLAAIVGGRETIENDPLSVATDLSIDSEFFNWCIRSDQDCPIIYFSSSAAYPIRYQTKGVAKRLSEGDINLNDMMSPDYTYGWAKLSGEYLAMFAKQYGKKVHVFRPFSGYGETQDLDYPFPSFMKRILERHDSFEIWGDGTQVRDFIHMEDIIKATLRAVELEILDPVNLGWGIPTCFNDLAHMAFEISGHTPKYGIKHLTDKPVGVMFRCSDSSFLHSFYKPEITLEMGIERALARLKK